MGSCASTPKGCVKVRSGLNLRRKHRRRRRRSAKAQSFSNKLSKVEPSNSTDVSYRNPAFQGTVYFHLFLALFSVSLLGVLLGSWFYYIGGNWPTLPSFLLYQNCLKILYYWFELLLSADFTGSSESWYDPDTVTDSDCDDDFYSVQDGEQLASVIIWFCFFIITNSST